MDSCTLHLQSGHGLETYKTPNKQPTVSKLQVTTVHTLQQTHLDMSVLQRQIQAEQKKGVLAMK